MKKVTKIGFYPIMNESQEVEMSKILFSREINSVFRNH